MYDKCTCFLTPEPKPLLKNPHLGIFAILAVRNLGKIIINPIKLVISFSLEISMLAVPYVKQINPNACGAAVLEMIYKFYGIEDISQNDLMQKYQEFEPHGSRNYRLSSETLVIDAKERNFDAVLFRANYKDKQDCLAKLYEFVELNKLPVIVCQKFTNEQPLMGHFRLVVGMNEDFIYVHDPFQDIEGNEAEWTSDQFFEFWQPTGEDVTGGIGCLIAPSGALDFLQQQA